MTAHHRMRHPSHDAPTVGDLICLGGRLLRSLLALVVLLALVAGLPWALVHFVGWPLPYHVPTWDETQATLLNPMSAQFLLDALAMLCWIVWFFFALEVLRCTVEVARDARLPDLSAAGPMHTLAGVLLGAVLVSIMGNRPAPTQAPLPTALGTGSEVVTTAPAWQNSPHSGETSVHNAVFAAHVFRGGSTTAPAHPKSVVVLAPDSGVYDSLSRIAQRTLGDEARWPEIFALNKGKHQPYGHTFTNPNLLYPGEELALPADAAAPTSLPRNPPEPPSTSPAPTTASPPTTAPSTSAQPSNPVAPAPSTRHAPPAATGTNSHLSATREPGFSGGSKLFVGLGLAAAVSAALLVARRRYRSGYRPGSGERDDLPVAPVVYQLRLAHLRAEQDDETDFDEGYAQCPERLPPPPTLVIGAPETPSVDPPTLAPGLGVRDGREIALDLAAARGLGLVGAGGPAAARALLVTALTAASLNHLAATSPPTGTVVLVPADDLVGLLGHGAAHAQRPAALRVVAGLDDALDALEAETLVRATGNREQHTAPGPCPALMLVARPPGHQRQRLQAVLDNGAPFGITGLLLGQWQPGVTAYVREDGTVSVTSPGLGETLRGTRMFHLGGEDTAELLTLLHQAEPDPLTHDGVHAPPAPRPGIVPAEPAGNHHPADTNLEIVDTHAVPTPGTRPRPRPRDQKPVPPSSATISTPDDTTPTTDDQTGGEVTAAPATVHESAPSAVAAVPIRITVLGPPQVFWQPEADSPDTEMTKREITGAFQPRTRELLVFLALHPGGVSREALVAALWWDNPPEKTTNAMNTALSRLRRSLSKATDGALSDITVVGDGRYRLDPAVVDVDYWRFEAALATRRAAVTEQQRIDAYREVVNSYGGTLADGMSAEWIETAREAIRRDAIDAVAALARALVQDDPQQTLDLLEVARTFDPHNEALYRDIMRLQERLGQIDAIPRTLTLLATRLAEIDDRPTEQAIALAARLRQRHDDNPVAS